MNPNIPPEFECAQCKDIVRALQDAWKADLQQLHTRLVDVAISSGRDPRSLGIRWIFSIAEMPDDEMQSLLRAHYSRVAEARKTKEQHESTTGHSIVWHGWWKRHPYGLGD